MKIDWLNRLGKWRSVFAGWQLGTRPDTDPECQAVGDHREVTMMLRAENNALIALLIRKGVFDEKEFNEQLQQEARFLCESYEMRFPGFRATDNGLEISPDTARKTTRNWKP